MKTYLELWIIAGLSILIFIGFIFAPSEPAPQASHTIFTPPKPPAPLMSEEAYPRGLTQPHKQRSNVISGLDEALGAGACIFDINNDGYMDIFVVPSSGHNRLFGRKSWWAKKVTTHSYINDSTGYFLTNDTGVDLSDLWGMGCASGDLNNDGWSDIVLSHRNGVILLINESGVLKKRPLWETNNEWPTSVTLEDIDTNGTLDIYVSNYLAYTKLGRTFEALSGYKDNNARAFEPSLYLGQANKLFINSGNFIFQEESREFNLENSDGRTLSTTFININNDHYPDLIINNDSGSPSQILINQSGEYFTQHNPNMEISLNARNTVHTENSSRDQKYFFGGDYKQIPIIANAVTFEDTGRQTITNPNAHLADNNFGSVRADINNDGELDIVFANGFSTPDPDSPANTQGLPNTALIANRSGNYERYVFTEGGSLSSRAAVRIDIDNDGDHDLLITNNNGPMQLWINNRGTHNWIGFTSKKDFTSVTVNTNKRTLHRNKAASSFLSSSDPRVSIQLQDNEIINTIEIAFSDKTQATFKKPAHNQYLSAHQHHRLNATNTTSTQKKSPQPSKLFKSLSKSKKLAQLSEISASKSIKQLGVVKTALNDKHLEVRIASIQALKVLEAEVGVHWLIDRLQQTKSTEEICTITDAFYHYYSEEEACPQNKQLAIPRLSHIAINYRNDDARICALEALSKTRATRAALTAESILLKTSSEKLRLAANEVLTNVRRGRKPISRLQYDNSAEDENHH